MTTYAKVEDGTAVQRLDRAPRTGTLPDGSRVSNLHHAAKTTIAESGWLPVTDDTKPTHDPDTQHVVAAPISEWKVRKNDVLRTWTVEDLPPPAPDVNDLFQAADQQLGRDNVRRLGAAYPDLVQALQRQNWQRARTALDDALDAGDLTDEQHQAILDLAAQHHVPLGTS